MKDPNRRTFREALVWTAVPLGLVYFLDRFYPQVTVAPLAGMLLLFGLSLWFPPRVIFGLFWIILVYVAWSLMTATGMDWEVPEHRVRYFIRIGTFSAGGVTAVLASLFRCQLDEMLAQTRELLAGLPVGVLLSDPQGRVVWANEACRRQLGSRPPEGRLWLEVMPHDGRLTDYALLFANQGMSKEVQNAFPDHAVRFVRLSGTRLPLLVTVIFPVEALEKPAL
jgi:PAS domain-containing protein